MRLRRISFITSGYSHIRRYRQILSVLVKYGFADLLERLHAGKYLRWSSSLFSRRKQVSYEGFTRHERVRMALEELGPAFVKMGQVLSTRPDLVSLKLVQELAKLQDRVPSFPFAAARLIVERELGAPLEDLFASFDPEPLAAASIGQVHRAVTKNGAEVIVKVQRPDISAIVAADLEIMFHLAELMEKYLEEGEIYRPTQIVEEFARVMEMEMNYATEALHQERFAAQFASNPSVKVPRVFRNLSSSLVLTMEYLEGIKVSDGEALDRLGYDRPLIASRGAELILEQIFQHRFFHADPHPGNIYILKGNIICYLDFGMMGRVGQNSREILADMILGYVLRDEKKIARAILSLVEITDEPDRRLLEQDVLDLIETHLYRPLKDLRVADFAGSLVDFFTRHRLRLPADIFLMVKALATTESIGAVLDPDFDMSRKIEPFIRSFQKERVAPGRLFKNFLAAGEELGQMVRELPTDLADIVKQIKKGRMKVAFEHRGLEKLIFEMDRASNRIAFALIISSIVVGSSLIITADMGPHLLGLPVLGLLGFSMAGLMGLGLIISILRSGRI